MERLRLGGSSGGHLLEQGPLGHVARHWVSMFFGCLEGRRLPSLSGPVLTHPHSKGAFSRVQTELPEVQLVPIASRPNAGHG